MANKISINAQKASITALSTSIASFVVYGGSAVLKQFGVDVSEESLPVLVVALTGIITGISDFIKHRK
jgi:hypothetical protein